jgi:hypothetical protein
MQIFQEAEKIGTLAVKNLRVKKLHNGIPFMINSRELPIGQTYLEYRVVTFNLLPCLPITGNLHL